MPDTHRHGALSFLLRIAARGAKTIAIALATLIVGFAVQARLRLPELQPWHRIELANEFRAAAADAPRTFPDYLALEQRLFAEVQQRVLAPATDTALGPTSRYRDGTVPCQLALGPHNRSHERVPANPRGSVLLVHGLSDSPYAMLAVEELCFGSGLRVLSLRLPGHGTIPAALLHATWQDWYAAVELAARHVASQQQGQPFYVCGYSTGAALLALLSVRSLQDPSLPRPQRLWMLSAAIGVSEFAALANVVSLLSFVPWFDRAAWLDVLPEYDPHKYNSFPVTAGNQIHRLTRQLQTECTAATTTPQWTSMPKVLAFQSVVDATVSASAVANDFVGRLRGDGHELVAFDVNRNEIWSDLLAPGPIEAMERIRAAGPLPYRLSVVANARPDTDEVALYSRDAGSVETRRTDLGQRWPRGVFALGHIALPFPSDDPMYGSSPREAAGPRWWLGGAPRGESGAIQMPLGSLARVRCNPFFDVIRDKIGAAVAADRGR